MAHDLNQGKLSPLERIGRGIELMLGPRIPGSRPWVPEIRIVDRRRDVVLRLVSPHVDPRKIRIQLSGRVLTLSAVTLDAVRQEHGYHAFKRSIVLPEGVDWRHISAEARGKVLTVRIPKTGARPSLRPAESPRKVRDLMTRQVRSVTPETAVAEAAAMMRNFDIGSVPVCRDGRVVGILTDRDIAIRVTPLVLTSTEVRVGDVMTRDPVTCGEEDDLLEVERVMGDEQIRRLPVVDRNGMLVGYLALGKIARHELAARSGRVLRGVSEPGKRNVRRKS